MVKFAPLAWLVASRSRLHRENDAETDAHDDELHRRRQFDCVTTMKIYDEVLDSAIDNLNSQDIVDTQVDSATESVHCSDTAINQTGVNVVILDHSSNGEQPNYSARKSPEENGQLSNDRKSWKLVETAKIDADLSQHCEMRRLSPEQSVMDRSHDSEVCCNSESVQPRFDCESVQPRFDSDHTLTNEVQVAPETQSVKSRDDTIAIYGSLDFSDSAHGSIGVLPQRNSSVLMSAPVLDFPDNCAIPLKVTYHLKGRSRSDLYGLLYRTIKQENKETALTKLIQELKARNVDICRFREEDVSAGILHIALLFKNETAARLLIESFPELVEMQYTSETFKNQTAFHIAAANGLRDIITCMIDSLRSKENREGIESSHDQVDRMINTFAKGTYFTEHYPEGALVLSAAICNGEKDMIPFLIEQGVRLELQGPGGNTLLHFVVYLSAQHPNSKYPTEVFDAIWESCDVWWQKYREGPEAILESNASENLQVWRRVHAFRELLAITNESGQSVLSLAVYIQANIASHILNFHDIYKLPQTKFGAISYATYDVTDVTSFGPQVEGSSNRYNPNSVLHILSHRAKIISKDSDKNYKDLIDEEPIASLVSMKWSVYKWVYIVWCFIHVGFMSGMTATLTYFNQPALRYTNATSTGVFSTTSDTNVSDNSNPDGQRPRERAVHLYFAAFLVLPIVYLTLELVDFLSVSYLSVSSYRAKPLERTYASKAERRYYAVVYDPTYAITQDGMKKAPPYLFQVIGRQYTITGNAPYRLSSLIFSIFFIAWFCLHIRADDRQDMLLCVAQIFGWLFVLFFTRGYRYISRFTIMVQKMFFQDFLYFIVVYVAILCAFSFAMHVLVQHYYNKYVPVSSTIYTMVNVITDAGSKAWDDPDHNNAGTPGKILLTIYAVLTVILMLNLLIAMMNTSYESVKNSQTNLLRHQQLSILLLLERRLWWLSDLCDSSQENVWSDDNERCYLEITERSSLSHKINPTSCDCGRSP